MITYKIIVSHTSPKVSNSKSDEAVDGLANQKALVLSRALKRCNFKVDDLIKVKGTSHSGKVVAIVTDERLINWEKMFPHYIHIELDGGIQRMAHHSQLKKVSK